MTLERIRYIDSHTGGEPTRLILSGMPDLGEGSLTDRAKRFAREYDHFRRAVVQEPRGSDVLVGALLQEPVHPEAAAGVIFFNNAGVLGMCGHGTIGVVESLAYLGRMKPGIHRLETSVGDITVTRHDDHRVSVRNVPSYRTQTSISLNVPDLGRVVGDVAWGGNWFFLVGEHSEELHLRHLRRLLEVTTKIRHALESAGIRGPNGEVIDHIELFGPAHDAANHSRNFVLCPGLEYDRSPCGTGTSAKLACLAAAGNLQPGTIWRQESIIGSVFESSYEWIDGTRISPTITGRAWVTGEGELIRLPDDPFRDGIRC